MTETEYSKIRSLRATELKHLLDCPARLKWEREQPRKSSPALRIGGMVHAHVLDPEALREFALVPECDRRTKEGRAAHAQFLADTEGKTAVTRDEWDTALDIAAAVRDWPNPDWQRTLATSTPASREKLLQLTDARTGVRCKARLDIIDGGTVWDIKTTRNVSPYAFAGAAASFGYALSAAFYLRGCEANGIYVRDWRWIAVTNKAPYFVRGYSLLPEDRAQADAVIDTLLETYAACQSSDEWPSYTAEVEPLPLPAYAFGPQEEPELEFETGTSATL